MAGPSLFIEEQIFETKLCVIVPVRDESEELTYTLDALYNQVDAAHRSFDKRSYEVLLLTNNCTDDSYELALSYKAEHPDFNLYVANIYIESERAHIGTVRRMLMDEAYNRFSAQNKPRGIIASTGGDTQVDSQWVANIISAIGKGIDVVGGRIISQRASQQSRLYHLQDVTYRYYVSRLESLLNPAAHDPWPRHFQCYGASVAVTCEAYANAGRLPLVPFLEDEEFRKSLYRIDAKVRMCPQVKVYTSSRMTGKVQFGFSVQLQEWANMKSTGKKVYVETVRSLIEKYELKHLLKSCWQSQRYVSDDVTLYDIAMRLRICPDWLKSEFRSSLFFGALWEKVEEKQAENGEWERAYPKAPIEKIIPKLRSYFSGNKYSCLKDMA